MRWVAIVLLGFAAAPRDAAAAPTACDVLSGMPPEMEIVTPDRPGLLTRDIDAIVEACRAARAAAPGEARFGYRLGLALKAAQRPEEAASVLADAVSLGSMGALDELASLKIFGSAPIADPPGGVALYEEGIARWHHPELMRGLASALENGPEDIRDPDQARSLLDQAIALGHAPALVSRGLLLETEGDVASAEALYQRASAAGSAWGAFELGDLNRFSNVRPTDPAAARRFYQLAADRGSARAMNRLGQMAAADLAGPWDDGAAAEWYGRAAALGYAPAMYNLAALDDSDTGDYRLARQWYLRAAARGDADSMNALGMLYDHGRGVAQDFGEARRWYDRGAAAGSACALSNIGYLYEQGRGIEVDQAAARRWYKRAAVQGCVQAQHNLAMMYLDGRGGPKAAKRGLVLLRQSADAGLAVGVSDLAWVYQTGTVVPQDQVRARDLFRQAADLGSFEAQHNLASMLENGQGGPKDLDEARRRFKLAAQAGIANAMYRYAMRIYYDEVSSTAWPEVRAWLAKAVAGGDLHGLALLARMTADGQGGPADPAEARRLFQLGAGSDPGLALEFAHRLRSGAGVPADPAAAAVILSAFAEADDAAAVELAEMMLAGEGSWAGRRHEARAEAAQLLETLTKRRQPRAMVLLAGILRDSGRAISAKRARQLLTDAAAAGEDTAFAPLAAMMEQGEGGGVDLFGAMHNLIRLRERDPAQAAALLRLEGKLAAGGTATDVESSALIRRLWGSPEILRAGLASIGFLALAIGAML
jgi:uncharacterized protein